MTAIPEDPTLPEALSADVAEAKPVRRKRTPKPAAVADVTEVVEPMPAVQAELALAPPEGADDGAAEGEAVVKPKRKRAPVKAKAEFVDDEALPAAEAEAVAMPVLPAVVADESSRELNASTSTAVDAPAGEPADGAAQAADDGGSDGDGPRERRRGRRERNRAERPPLSDDPSAAPGAVPAPQPKPVEAGELFAQVLSGEFDIAGEPTEEVAAVPPKRVLLPEPEAPKLHKVLAQAGIGSRRDMEEAIQEGKVTVNGEVAHTGQRISFGDQVKVGGKPVRLRITPPPPRIIAYHKPVGEIVTNDDPQHRPTVYRRLPRLQQGKWQSVGRLDINTEGLLLFTNSGELANQLMHPRFGVEREYAVRVLGTLEVEAKAQLLEGVDIDGQKASFRSVESGGGEGANHWYRVVITEGRNREVRRLFDAVGLTVSRLIRIRYGTVVLPHGLKRGVWVDLEEGDVRAIRRLASGGDNAPREQRTDNRGNANANANANDRGPNGNRPRNDRNDRKDRNDRNARGPNNGPRGAERPPQQQPPAPYAAADRGFERDDDEDLEFDPSKIPNPLEQTFDKRFVQNPRSPAGGRGFRSGGGGFGAGGSAPQPVKKGPGPKQPDPLQTSVGYIGADAFHRKGGGGGGGGGGNRGGRGGGGGGFGGFGGGGGGGGGGRRGR